MTWSCTACRKTYRSGTPACSSADCAEIRGSTKTEAVNNLLDQINRMMAEAVSPCTQENPRVLNAVMLATEVLSPHGHHLEGLKPGAWSTNASSKCDCDARNLEEARFVGAGSSAMEEEEALEEVTESPPPNPSLAQVQAVLNSHG